jgi:hypothetical protein
MHLKVFTDNDIILVNEDCFVHSGWGQRATLCIYYKVLHIHSVCIYIVNQFNIKL